MQIRKALITAAGPAQRRLPLQTVIDRDGRERSVLALLVEEAVLAGVEDLCVVVHPGDAEAYAAAVSEHAGRLHFLEQTGMRGYAQAVFCAREFTGADPFLHMVADHLFVGLAPGACAQRLVGVASAERCSVSAVQPTHESLLPHFGCVGGQPVTGCHNLYRVDAVIEKPTPTEAEQRLIVPGLRAGQYLCFFGMHVLTPVLMEILDERLSEAGNAPFSLSDALAVLAVRERYLALEMDGRRYDLGVRYGLFAAQLALALNGRDRDEVLTRLVQVLASAHGPRERAQ
jgi:UTP--glucose-1-phosphate uridylyltransferase